MFVHVKQTGARLEPGTKVIFSIKETPRGPRAIDVQRERLRTPPAKPSDF
jgi:cold shock CspA family protein